MGKRKLESFWQLLAAELELRDDRRAAMGAILANSPPRRLR
jgi:hypothetical protein